MNRKSDDRPQRVPKIAIVVTVLVIAVVVAGIALRIAMDGRLWPYPGSGPFPGT